MIGKDLEMNMKLSLKQALIGCTVDFTHLNGEILNITIPKGKVIKPNDTFKLTSKGNANANT